MNSYKKTVTEQTQIEVKSLTTGKIYTATVSRVTEELYYEDLTHTFMRVEMMGTEWYVISGGTTLETQEGKKLGTGADRARIYIGEEQITALKRAVIPEKVVEEVIEEYGYTDCVPSGEAWVVERKCRMADGSIRTIEVSRVVPD